MENTTPNTMDKGQNDTGEYHIGLHAKALPLPFEQDNSTVGEMNPIFMEDREDDDV